MMKATACIVLTVCAGMSAVPSHGQSDPKATVAALDTVIRKYSNYKSVLDPFVDDACSKFKKNPQVMTDIARAYYSFSKEKNQQFYTFSTRDSANAYKYIGLAIEADPSYVPAYIHGGDIQMTMADSSEAFVWYERAIDADRKNPSGYLSYASLKAVTDPDAAVRKLEEILAVVPGYPVYLEAARIYDDRADAQKAVEYYDKADRNQMTVEDLVNYSMYCYLLKDYSKSLEVSQSGNGRFPANPQLNRLTLWNNAALGNNEEALRYADLLFNKSDNPEIQAGDYEAYGSAYFGLKRYSEAIAMFSKLERFGKATEADKNRASERIISAYQEMGEYDKALEVCKGYIDRRRREDKLSAYDLSLMGRIYMEQAETLNGKDKIGAWQKADSVYVEMTDRFPANADFALYWRLMLAYKQDPESSEGLGCQVAEKLAAVVLAKSERSDVENARLVFAWRYLGYYYTFVRKNKIKGRRYWEKILEIDPENTAAKQVLGIS